MKRQGTILARFLLFVAFVPAMTVFGSVPTSAQVPGLDFTNTGCEGYSDSVARLYTAGLNRTPERGGFEYWMQQYTLGRISLMGMADFFASSPEFTTNYGSLTQEEFIRQIYRNILGREGEPEGVAYWAVLMTNGLTRGNLLVLFSESTENINRSGTAAPTLGVFNNGLDQPWSCGGWAPEHPDPVVVVGVGDQVVNVDKPNDYYLADITYDGGGHFAIWSYDAAGNRIDLLANTVGSYQGRVTVDIRDNEDTAALEVTASGPWSVTYYPFSAARVEAASVITGSGDDVFLLTPQTTGLTIGEFSTNGDGYFGVWGWGDRGRDLLVNKVGPYTGQTVIEPGTGLFEVSADGPWSITIE